MVRFAHAFIFYIAMVITGLMLFFSSCHAAQPLPTDSIMSVLVQSDTLVKRHHEASSTYVKKT